MNKLLLIDTREKPKAIETILKQFEAAGVSYIRTKLLFGDYMDYNQPTLVIDRKQNVLELAKNVTTDRARFVAELDRAKAAGAKLVILVEQNRYKDRDKWVPIRDISDLMLWSNEYTKIRGEKVFRVLSELRYKYNLSVVFCDKRTTARKILQIIYGEF